MTKFEAEKAEPEILDFVINYSLELALSTPVDVLQSSAWTQEDSHADDLTIEADSIANDDTIVRVSSGGRIGVKHYLVNRVTTVGGQIWQRTIEVKMVRR